MYNLSVPVLTAFPSPSDARQQLTVHLSGAAAFEYVLKNVLYHLEGSEDSWGLYVVHGPSVTGFVDRAMRGITGAQVGTLAVLLGLSLHSFGLAVCLTQHVQ